MFTRRTLPWGGSDGGQVYIPLTPSFIAFSLFCGIAPDLDLLVGWALGDINGYHHLGSHSLAAACVFGFLVLLVVQRFTQSWGSADGYGDR